MADAAVGGRERGHLVHDLGGGQLRLRVSHAVHDLGEDVGVQARALRPLHRAAHALDAALGVGERALLLGVAATRQHDVGKLGRLGEEQVLHHEEIERRERLEHMAGVGIGAHGVLAEQVEALDAARQHRREALGRLGARPIGQLHTPRLLELGAHGGIPHLLIAGVVVGAGPHVAGALDVVLAAQRVHARARLAQVARHHRDVGQRHHAVGAGGVLGHAQAVQDRGAAGRAVHLDGGHQVLHRDAAGARHVIGRELLHLGLHDAEALGALVHEVLVREAEGDEQVDHAVGERHVGAGAHAQMDVRLLREPDAAGIHHDQAAAALDRLADAHADDRMRLLGIGAHQHDDVGVLDDIVDGVGHRA